MLKTCKGHVTCMHVKVGVILYGITTLLISSIHMPCGLSTNVNTNYINTSGIDAEYMNTHHREVGTIVRSLDCFPSEADLADIISEVAP